MNRVYLKCPTCGSKECGDIRCRFTGKEHKDAAPQATKEHQRADATAVQALDDVRGADSAIAQLAASAPINAAPHPEIDGLSSGRANKLDRSVAVAAPDIGYECAWPR